MHTMTSHIHAHVYTVSDTHIHTHTQSHIPRYHSGGDKTHAVQNVQVNGVDHHYIMLVERMGI